tara:strand:- start:416 stop:643 length:228 start_codon:yes stop_codon:yes gene_type:complete
MKTMKPLTQKDRIIRHLKDKGSITALEAMKEYGIMRLTSRICELKDQGYNIKSEFVSSKNRYNESVSFSKYSLTH